MLLDHKVTALKRIENLILTIIYSHEPDPNKIKEWLFIYGNVHSFPVEPQSVAQPQSSNEFDVLDYHLAIKNFLESLLQKGNPTPELYAAIEMAELSERKTKIALGLIKPELKI